MLGVHANTVRAWTDQGRLRCLRINERGDRRYALRDLHAFLARAGRVAPTTAATGDGPLPGEEPAEPATDADSGSRGPRDEQSVTLLRRAAALCTTVEGRRDVLAAIPSMLREAGYTDATLVPASGDPLRLMGTSRLEAVVVRQARRARQPVSVGAASGPRALLAVPLNPRPGDTLVVRRGGPSGRTRGEELELLALLGAQLSAALAAGRRAEEMAEERRRMHILQAVGSDISAQLDLGRILNRLLTHSTELFAADRACVLRRMPTGAFVMDQSINLSQEFREAVEHAHNLPLTQLAFEQGRIVSATDYADDPRGVHLRPALLREGINTVTVAPLVSDGELLGALLIYHDTRYVWRDDDLELLEQLAGMGSVAVKNARNYSQMATWAAQLQSIQQLGARLTRLNSVNEIGQAIAAELNQLIDYHNVRVYRIEDDEVVPVAWRGAVGEYDDEDGSQLRVRVGQGITGWVARYGVAQYLPDAAADRRTETIPGTEDDLDESLLLAPMLYEDEVIGVIVLAKLGLHQFTGDDLRLLEIYASIAAQALANADVTEKLRAKSYALERQLQSQRELLRVTESILGTLDAQELLDEIANRLGTLLHTDNVAVHLYDPEADLVRPIFARGRHAELYLRTPYPGSEGVSADVLRTGEAELVQDVLADTRIAHFDEIGPEPGAVIIAPLRSRGRVSGLITIHRIGRGARFGDDEFELVKLFAGHASIALGNAETHRAVELRAQTDRLTGLKNHGALVEQLMRRIGQGQTFSLLMLDLDGFKAYNDTQGHEAGNVMLKRIADVIRASCRESDEVFRYGGDEFTIILPGTSTQGGVHVAHKIRRAVRGVNTGLGRPRITCSIGVASHPADGADRSTLVQAADRACFAAKRSGGDRALTASEALELGAEVGAPAAAPAESYSTA